MAHDQGQGVELPRGHAGSSYLHGLLLDATERYPAELAEARLPTDTHVFKSDYADALVRFEAARVKSQKRSEIARFVCLSAERDLRFVAHGTETPLAEVMAQRTAPLPVLRVEHPRPPQLIPSVGFEGRLYRGAVLHELTRELRARHWITAPASRALELMVERARDEGGHLSLVGERFVLLGAAADLAPTGLLLEAGAEVLWVDVREPTADHLLEPRHAGVLHYVKGGADLLVQPQAIAATIEAFASRGPVHLGMYAYAGGANQEFRLTAAMNAIARNLPRSALKSIAMLLSPTTPAVVSDEDAQVAAQRKRRAPAWQRALVRTGQLSEGQLRAGDFLVSRSIVPTQGVSYQVAQYVGKMLAAEAYATFGNALGETPAPLTVSANVAPITATRSLSHPVFEAAFLGAPLFDIWISKPSTTRALSGLLTVHDVLHPEAPGSATQVYATSAQRAKALFSAQVHGGVYAQPFALEGCIAVAALKGLAQRPKLALGLLR